MPKTTQLVAEELGFTYRSAFMQAHLFDSFYFPLMIGLEALPEQTRAELFSSAFHMVHGEKKAG